MQLEFLKCTFPSLAQKHTNEGALSVIITAAGGELSTGRHPTRLQHTGRVRKAAKREQTRHTLSAASAVVKRLVTMTEEGDGSVQRTKRAGSFTGQTFVFEEPSGVTWRTVS